MDVFEKNYPACLSQTLIKKYAITPKATNRIMSYVFNGILEIPEIIYFAFSLYSLYWIMSLCL